MIIFFGFRDYGRIKTLYGESILTHFFHIFWLPLIPFGSRYSVEVPQGEVNSFVYRWWYHPYSVLLGYLRVWAGLLGFPATLFFFGDVTGDLATLVESDWLFGPGLLVVWGLAMFLLGRSGKQEREIREIIACETRLYALPRWLRKKDRKAILQKLENKWQAAAGRRGLSTELRGVSAAALPADVLELAYGLIEYRDAVEADGDNKELKERIRARIALERRQVSDLPQLLNTAPGSDEAS